MWGYCMNKPKGPTSQQLKNIRKKYANRGYDEHGLFEVIKAVDSLRTGPLDFGQVVEYIS